MEGRPILWPIVACSGAIALLTIAVVSCLIRGRTAHAIAAGLSPPLASSVCGLLCGLSLLVMLPSAMEALEGHGRGHDHSLVVFVGAIVGMYFLHHVVLDHQCGAAALLPQQQPKAKSEDGKSKRQGAKPPNPWQHEYANGMGECGPCCQPVDEDPQQDEEGAPLLGTSGRTAAADQPPWCLECCGRATAHAVRTGAWFAHALLDGAMLGASPSVAVLLATCVPVALCAVQVSSPFPSSPAFRLMPR